MRIKHHTRGICSGKGLRVLRFGERIKLIILNDCFCYLLLLLNVVINLTKNLTYIRIIKKIDFKVYHNALTIMKTKSLQRF